MDFNIIENTLDTEIETWDDPGDYPSGAGGGSLASYDYVADVTGTLTIRFNEQDIAEYELGDEKERLQNTLDDGDWKFELDHGVEVTKWRVVEVIGRTAILEVEEFEGGSVIEGSEIEEDEPPEDPED